MNILLIHPYITANSPATVLTEPVGLMSLATYLEASLDGQAKVDMLDLYALGRGTPEVRKGMYVFGLRDRNEIRNLLKARSPDLVGIHCNFTGFCDDAYELAATAKSALPGCRVVLGGAHATMEAESILREQACVDFVVCGEGELTLTELARVLSSETDPGVSEIKGLCYRAADGSVIRNPERELIADINELPVPDRRFIDTEFYMRMNERSLPFTKKRPPGIIMTSRGCPFNCIFCSTKMMWKRRWRPLSAERVIQDIEHLVQAYGVREIVIYDDQFIIDKDRVHQICDHLIESRLNITLSIPAGTSVWLLDEALLKKMKQAGFYRLCFPIESGSRRTIEFIRKKIDLNEVKEKIRIANRLGFWTQGNFILGFPYETRQEIEETIEYAYNCGLDYVFFYIAKPFAGSEMYDIYKKEGLLDKVARSSQIYMSDCSTTTLSAEELNEIYARAARGFWPYKIRWYLKPSNFPGHLLPKFKSLDDIGYAAKLFYVLALKGPLARLKVTLSGAAE